ncbi:MAG TPA: HEAT repeat domain-containing protein [Planctomycetaceae bacterium]|jgi:HEAT repeat protein
MVRRLLIGGMVCGSLLLFSVATLPAAGEKADDLLPMVVKLIGDKDKEFRAAGLDQVRTGAKGPEATKLFAAQLPKLDESAQVALLSALADRGDTAARPAVLELLGANPAERVRIAAIVALGKLGQPDDLPLLIKLLSDKSDAERTAARSSLTQIRGETISSKLAAALDGASPAVKASLIDVLANRRARNEGPAFLAASVDDNAQVRSAAMSALGRVAKPEQIADMLPGVLKAEKGGERDAAERNVALACSRIENEDQRGETFIKALARVNEDQTDQLLSLMGRVGGKKLINFVADIATGKDAARRKLGIDALSKWPDASVADKLLEITTDATDSAERSQAFQGYVKISATRDNRNDRQRLDRMKQAMKIAKTPEEQTLVINRCRTAYDVETVRFVLPYVDQPAFAQVACETIVEIAHHREVRDPHKSEFDKALDKVIEISKDPVVVDRAGRYKRGETWTRRG